jgi:Type IV secretion system pilin
LTKQKIYCIIINVNTKNKIYQIYLSYMFSTTLKTIVKTLSVIAIFTALSITSLSNVNASAIVCAGVESGYNGCPATTGTANTGGSTGNQDLTPNNLCGNANKCPLIGTAAATGGKLATREGVSNFILNIARFLIYIASAISVIFIVWGGYQYINAADPKGAENGKKILINAIIGLAVCILAVTIVTFLGSTLEGNLVGSVVGG